MYVFDEVAFSAWMKARGMKFDGNVLVMYDNKAMKLTTLKSALRNKRRIYMPINIGTSSGKSGRLKNEDVEVCLNWQIDFEYPEDPPKAIKVGLLFLQKLIQNKWAEQGQDMQESGAGCRIILGTEPIFTKEKGQAQNISNAWKQVVIGEGSEINNLFQKCCKKIGVEMKIDFCPISQPAAPDGSWRYHNPKKNDNQSLHNGFLRKRIVGDGERHESARLRAAILDAYEHPLKKEEYIENIEVETVDLETEANMKPIVQHAINYTKKYNILYKSGSKDRTKAYCTLINAMAKRHGREITLKSATLLNEVVESPYDDRQAIKVAHGILSNFKPTKSVTQDNKFIYAPERGTPNVDLSFQEKDTLKIWSNLHIKKVDGKRSVTKEIYNHYVSWMNKRGEKPISQRQFTRFFISEGCETKVARVDGYEATQQCFINIELILEDEIQIENDTEMSDKILLFEVKRNKMKKITSINSRTT